MYYASTYRRYGLGDAAQDVQMAAGVATPVVAATAGASVASILGVSLAVAVPVIGAAIAGITLGVVALLRSGCGKTCIMTSKWAEDAEALLAQNIAAYFASNRTRSQQKAALAHFDAIWDYLVAECGQDALGGAGVNCIQDRKAGACKWRQRADSLLLAYPGEPQPGECWNWVSGYRDPIANDPHVTEDPSILSEAETSLSSFFGGGGAATPANSASPLMLAAGIALIVVAGVALS